MAADSLAKVGSIAQEDEVSADLDADECTPLVGEEKSWTPPPGFVWIQVAIFANVFLGGFDGTIMASTYTIIGSQFHASNYASWLTTSYLITSTAFQPLYGRFSDLFGRRLCFFFCTISFMIGCFGCAVAPDIISLILTRAVTGFGGGGLVTMATIINSDIIPFERRGIYQATQNILAGFGAISGASFGGAIAEAIGWRWCFLLQVPFSILAVVVGYYHISNPPRETIIQTAIRDAGDEDVESILAKPRSLWSQVDFCGSSLLVLGLSAMLVGTSLGGNELPWSNPWVISSLAGSGVLIVLFLIVEAYTSAVPVVPLRMLRGRSPVATQISNACVGMAAYVFIFTLPLFFQVVLLESASKAGSRLVIPSLAAPVGGFTSGWIMSRWGHMTTLVRVGTLILTIGSALILCFEETNPEWKYLLFTFPANLGAGLSYPALLFTVIAAFEHHEQAVSTSLVYLIRQLGNVWGVALSSATIQTILASGLPSALADVPDKQEIIEAIRHSVYELNGLPPDIRMAAQEVYYNAIQAAFALCLGMSVMAFLASLLIESKKLSRSK